MIIMKRKTLEICLLTISFLLAMPRVYAYQYIPQDHTSFDNSSYAKKTNTNSKNTKKKNKKYTYSKYGIGFSFGYGMLNWSKSDAFLSTPNDNIYELNFWRGSKWTVEFSKTLPMTKNIHLEIGLGYESNVFRFANSVGFASSDGSTITNNFSIQTDNVRGGRAKLVARYVTIPVMLNIDFDKSNGIVLGAVGGINFRTSHTGFKKYYDGLNDQRMYETWGTKYNNFNDFKLDLHIGYNYNNFELYFRRSVTKIFKDDKEKDLCPFAIGIIFHTK